MRLLCWGGGAKSDSQCSEKRECLESSGKIACEITARIKCIKAEGSPRAGKGRAGCLLEGSY